MNDTHNPERQQVCFRVAGEHLAGSGATILHLTGDDRPASARRADANTRHLRNAGASVLLFLVMSTAFHTTDVIGKTDMTPAAQLPTQGPQEPRLAFRFGDSKVMSSSESAGAKIAQKLENSLKRLDCIPKFSRLLFRLGDFVSLRMFETWEEDGRKRSRVDFSKSRAYAIHRFVRGLFLPICWDADRNHLNVHFGVCPREGERGFDNSWQIRTVLALWADVDDCTVEEALKRCEVAGLPKPSIVVSSGNGSHFYLLLETPYLIDDVGPPPQVEIEWTEIDEKRKPIHSYIDPENGDKVYLDDPRTGRPIPHARPRLSPKAIHVQDVLKGIASKIGADHTSDLARLLRMPGTYNRKDERNGREPKLCEIVEMEDRRYSFSEFERFATESPDAQRREKVAAIKLPTVRKITPARQDRLNELLAICDAVEPGDRSEPDFALCCYAIRNGVARDKLWQMVQSIGKFGESGEPYFALTWNNAADSVQEQLFEKAFRKANPSRNGAADKTSGRTGTTAAGKPDDDRPIIEVTTDEYLANEAAAQALARDKSLYQRAGSLVHVVWSGEARDGIIRAAHSPRIILLPVALLRDRLTANAKFVQISVTDEGPKTDLVHVPQWCVKAILERGKWPGVRYLEGIVETPILRPDGSVLSKSGYDKATGLLYVPNCNVPHMPDTPSLADALAARDLLLDLVCDFPFATPAHRASWLAYLLTALARFAFHGCTPLFLLDANVRASGKSLLCDLIALIILGREMARMSNPREDDEVRKRITALALAGDSLVLIDNIAESLGSPSLDAALTATVWKDRILGRSEIVEMSLRVIWAATGNNVILQADTSRRVCHIRLESPEENPEEREGFKHANLREYVRQNRPQLLAAALTILRAYCAAGRPDQHLKLWGSFEAWSDLVRQPIVWIGLADPGDTRQELASRADRDAEALRGLIGGWQELDPGGNGLTASEALKKLELHSNSFEQLRTAILDLCHAPAGKLPSVRSLGNKLRHLRGRIVGGHSIDCRERSHTKVWYVAKAEPVKSGKMDAVGEGEGDVVTGSEGSTGSYPTHPYTREVSAHGRCGAHDAYRQGGEKDPAKPSDPVPEKPVEIQHKDHSCKATDFWEHIWGGRYCRLCWPPTEPGFEKKPAK